jgi:ribose 5-phosphate isomerase A
MNEMAVPSDCAEAGKLEAGVAAAQLVRSGMRIGLGTGSTVRYTILEVGRRLGAGELQDVLAVPTSIATAELAGEAGVPIMGLDAFPRLDLCIDGADEVDPDLQLIKGLGAALMREKIVAQASDAFVVVADDRKLVEQLGTRSPLPVAVLPFAWQCHLGFLAELGCEPALRRLPSGEALITDDGLFILDCRFPDGISDPSDIESQIARRPGLVGSGLFLDMADSAFIAGVDGLRRIARRA